MKDIFQQIYSNFLRLTHLQKSDTGKMFPKVGFLEDKRKQSLEKTLGVKISNLQIYEQALTHRSYLQVVNIPNLISNERLEFLGDSILGAVIAEYLFYNYTQDQEGELTKMRSWLVNRKSLGVCARQLHLEEFLMVSFSASQSLQKGNETMLSDAMEAIIAAIYLDSGMETAEKFIVQMMLPIMMNEQVMKDTNFKSILLELVQSEGKEPPRYVVMSEAGPDHEKEFVIGVYVGGECLGTGSGKNKKQAEQFAAKQALDKSIISEQKPD